MTRMLEEIQRFFGCRNGNIALLFGLLLMVMLAAAGVALDFQRQGAAKTDLQESADAALIAAVRAKMARPNMTISEMETMAQSFLSANRNTNFDIDISAFNIVYDAAKSTYTLDIDAGVETMLAGLFGRDALAANTLSQLKLGKPPFLEVVMVLDNTGSMNSNGKLTTLKTAAGNLVTSLFSHPDAQVKIGLVPFAQYVSVGSSYAGSNWLDGSTPGNSFNGCVGSRDYPANTQDDNYVANTVPEVSGEPCPDALLPLTDVKSTIDTAITDMDANGWTYIPAGLAWGWRVISADAPFDEGVAYDDLKDLNGYKSIILMTDGENTRSPDYPTHNNSNIIAANQLTEELCDAIKDEDIILYTIAFEVSDTTIKQLLEDCASTTDHYFAAENSADLVAAFDAISMSLRSISLSK